MFSLVYIFISIVLGAILSNGLIMFLGWNMLLATIVMFLAHLLKHLIDCKKHKAIIFICFILWVIFYPNTFYILTDFIHFQAYEFFAEYPSVYTMKILDWIVFTHIVIGALYGLKLGVDALDMLILYINKNRILLAALLFIASSFGIYLGRFMRLNSWDIFKITTLFTHFMDHFTFIISFVIMMSIIQFLAYFIFKKNKLLVHN